MLVAATFVFLYYTIWTLLMVRWFIKGSPTPSFSSSGLDNERPSRPQKLLPYLPTYQQDMETNTRLKQNSPSSTRTTPSKTSSPLANGPSASP